MCLWAPRDKTWDRCTYILHVFVSVRLNCQGDVSPHWHPNTRLTSFSQSLYSCYPQSEAVIKTSAGNSFAFFLKKASPSIIQHNSFELWYDILLLFSQLVNTPNWRLVEEDPHQNVLQVKKFQLHIQCDEISWIWEDWNRNQMIFWHV